MNYLGIDKSLIWHPFTQEKTATDNVFISSGKGSYLYDNNGKAYLDLISSWWTNIHGHCNTTIAKAIYKQAKTLEHVIFAGFTHEPAITLCNELNKLLPNRLSKFFFSDNGSTAVEVALKMAYQYWHNQKPRTLFLSFEGGYHGDTFGAMSAGAKGNYHTPFAKLFFEVLTIPFPQTWDDDIDVEIKEQASLFKLKEHLIKNGSNIAAIIIEPLIQGASGMRVCRSSFINRVLNMVKEYGILIIFDEVITGFGRCGSTFAFEQIDIKPDLLCLSKGLTGGFLPLALTVTTEDIYKAFYHDDLSKAFMHGHSYTANPLGCAAAIASLKLLLKSPTQSAIKVINKEHRLGLNMIKNNCNIAKNFRLMGTIAAFDISVPNEDNILLKLKAQFLDAGLLVRPLGNTIYFLPPYSIKSRELKQAYKATTNILNEWMI